MHGGTVQSDSTQGYTWAHTGYIGVLYTGVHRGTQGYTRVLRGTRGYTGWGTYTAHKLYKCYTYTGVQRSAQAESLVCSKIFSLSDRSRRRDAQSSKSSNLLAQQTKREQGKNFF